MNKFMIVMIIIVLKVNKYSIIEYDLIIWGMVLPLFLGGWFNPIMLMF